MFNKVHHVTYVVENVDDMASYLDQNFGLKPIRSDEFTDRGFKSVLYQIGETLVDFFEPLRDDTPMAQQLRATGPGGHARCLGRGEHRQGLQRPADQGQRNARRRAVHKPIRLQDRQHRAQQLPPRLFPTRRRRA